MKDATRRELLRAILGVPVGLLAGCSQRVRIPENGSVVGSSHAVGHRLRDGFRPMPSQDAWEESGVVIVGGGIAGLAAAWHLKRAGYSNFVVLELEPRPGGTSASGSSPLTPFPWGAHYVPAPMKEDTALIKLLDEMSVLEGTDPEGEPVIAEQYLCRDPQERIFFQGSWHEGLYPYEGASATDLQELKRFRQIVDQWVTWRDSRGRRAFALPSATCSDDSHVTELDGMSMADWLARHTLSSSRLRWLVDYACRDDYCLTAEQTSAWAGLFYFASRVPGPGRPAQPLITWPEGNGRFVRHFMQQVGEHVRLGWAVTEVIPHVDGPQVVAFNSGDGRVIGLGADRVIFAAPQLLAPHLIRGYRAERDCSRSFRYGAWLVANLILRDRPAAGAGFPLCWDNVFYDSPSLGYVVATHQTGMDYGPTVLTYYYPLCDSDPRRAWQRLLSLSWEEWAEVVLSDMARAHPGIDALVSRCDLMRWGHAMIRPEPGFVWGQDRRRALKPYRSIHFAHTDLSGMALFEEALYHGIRAAGEVLEAQGFKTEFKTGG